MSLNTITFFENITHAASSNIVSVEDSKYLQLDISGDSEEFELKIYAQVVSEGEYLPIAAIGNNSFTGCSNLRCIALPDGLTTIPGEAFNSCTNLALQSLPNQLVKIGRYAFYNCTNLVFTNFPNTVKEIDLYAFSHCSKLTTIDIPDGVSNYSTSTFEYCTNLTQILGRSSTLTKINQSFAAGTALAALVLPNITAVPELHGSAFNKTPIANGTGYIYVPENLVESFKTHNQWIKYANQIKGIGEYVNT